MPDHDEVKRQYELYMLQKHKTQPDQSKPVTEAELKRMIWTLGEGKFLSVDIDSQ